MKLTTWFLSSALLLSTAGIAAAAPGHGPDRIERRDLRRPVARPMTWQSLGSIAVSQQRTKLDLQRGARVDALKLTVDRGTVLVKKVIVTFADGSRYVAKVDQRLGVNASHVIDLPGAAKRIASIELRSSASRRGQVEILAR